MHWRQKLAHDFSSGFHRSLDDTRLGVSAKAVCFSLADSHAEAIDLGGAHIHALALVGDRRRSPVPLDPLLQCALSFAGLSAGLLPPVTPTILAASSSFGDLVQARP